MVAENEISKEYVRYNIYIYTYIKDCNPLIQHIFLTFRLFKKKSRIEIIIS